MRLFRHRRFTREFPHEWLTTLTDAVLHRGKDFAVSLPALPPDSCPVPLGFWPNGALRVPILSDRDVSVRTSGITPTGITRYPSKRHTFKTILTRFRQSFGGNSATVRRQPDPYCFENVALGSVRTFLTNLASKASQLARLSDARLTV